MRECEPFRPASYTQRAFKQSVSRLPPDHRQKGIVPVLFPVHTDRLRKLQERLALQARADLFNIFNHPNFGSPINYLSFLYSGNRRRCWERRLEAAARVAASIRCTKLADRARFNWL